MGKADFGAVDEAIAGGFEECEVGGVFGVEDDAFESLLCMMRKGRNNGE